MAPRRNNCCGAPDDDDKKIKKVKAPRPAGTKKAKGKRRVPNMFILYFLDMYKKHGGNMYCVAKEAGRRWRNMSQEQKDVYKKKYCALCKACKTCNKSSKSGGGGGKKPRGGKKKGC